MKESCVGIISGEIKQGALLMDERKRHYLTMSFHDSLRSELHEAGLGIVRSGYRGKSEDSIKRKIKENGNSSEKKPIWDLCGLRFFLKTDEEIDKVVNWFKENYGLPEMSESKLFWIKDFRGNKEEEENNFNGVCIGLSFKLIDKEEYRELVEIQLMKEE